MYSPFLLQLIAGKASSIPEDPAWQWEKFIAAASDQTLLPAIHGLLENGELLTQVPPDIADFFFAAKELNRTRNRDILERIRITAAALNQAGIEPLLLKGAAYLLADVYTDSADRFLVDIDFLIARDQIPAALDVLCRLSYTFERVDPIDHATYHTYAVLSRSDSMTIDLHQTVGLGASSQVLPTQQLLARSSTVTLHGARVRIPALDDLVTHHILHSQIHELYRDRIWTPLRSLYELTLLQRRFTSEINWQFIIDRFAQHRLYGDLALYFLLAEKTMNFEPPLKRHVGPFLMLRWWHRHLLRRFPSIRFIDPIWFYRAGVLPRTRRLRAILQQPGGLRYLRRKLFSSGFYSRLKTDLSGNA